MTNQLSNPEPKVMTTEISEALAAINNQLERLQKITSRISKLSDRIYEQPPVPSCENGACLPLESGVMPSLKQSFNRLMDLCYHQENLLETIEKYI